MQSMWTGLRGKSRTDVVVMIERVCDQGFDAGFTAQPPQIWCFAARLLLKEGLETFQYQAVALG